MLNRKRFKIVAIFAVLASAIGMTACRHHSRESHIDHISEKIADKLDFNDAQKVLLNDLKSEIKSDMVNEKQYHLAVKEEVSKMILAPELNQARLKELFNERHKRMQEKADKYISKISGLHKSLNSEQKETVVKKINEFAEHWE